MRPSAGSFDDGQIAPNHILRLAMEIEIVETLFCPECRIGIRHHEELNPFVVHESHDTFDTVGKRERAALQLKSASTCFRRKPPEREIRSQQTHARSRLREDAEGVLHTSHPA